MTRPTRRSPSIADAYFAGLIDGEGTICIVSNGPARRNRRSPMIGVGMTDRAAIVALCQQFGGGPIFRPRQKEHWNDCWFWHATDARARIVIWRVLPHLITKRADAIVAIRHWQERGLWTLGEDVDNTVPLARGRRVHPAIKQLSRSPHARAASTAAPFYDPGSPWRER